MGGIYFCQLIDQGGERLPDQSADRDKTIQRLAFHDLPYLEL